DTTWHKVVVHGVSTRDFDTPQGLEEVKRDIEEYNPGLYIQNTPIWLTLAKIRKEKAAGTILLAFKTRGEA
ncbi:hypothetical protein CERZMDRAFT_15829, partial [Cercospora zeae-maydis SCOH1-5]